MTCRLPTRRRWWPFAAAAWSRRSAIGSSAPAAARGRSTSSRASWPGLTIAEIELASEDEAFARPDWIGEEVTGDPRYYNQALARAAEPPPAA